MREIAQSRAPDAFILDNRAIVSEAIQEDFLGVRAVGAFMSLGRTVARVAASQRSPKRAAGSRLADERLQCVVELAADFYWEQDEQHRFTVYRPGGEPDAELEGLVGKTSWELFSEPAEAGGWAPFVATLAQRTAVS